ncbi:hypothetical protein MMC14_007238 [Varicellaria rhodocarpa]|nr:hypothetical protein [Varicellaria rhodocarpa]
MGKKHKVLSEAEIWDDSALIQSWDNALKEYKLYHSIYANGERVEDVLRAAEEEEADATSYNAMEEANRPGRNEMEDGSLEDGEVEDRDLLKQNLQTSAGLRACSFLTEAALNRPSDSHETSEVGVARPSNGVSGIPQTVIDGSSQDEALKNLMMSWYWAGYYTGHFEGQEQAKNDQNKQKNGG